MENKATKNEEQARTANSDQEAVSLRTWQPEPYPDGNEDLSGEIDSIVYGEQP